jgi:hypothetical protein
VRFGEAVEPHAAPAEALQVHDGGHHALSAEPVQSPEQDKVELSLASVVEQRGEPLPLVSALPAALKVDVFADDVVSGMATLVSQLHQLVLRILTFVVGADPRVNRDPHITLYYRNK